MGSPEPLAPAPPRGCLDVGDAPVTLSQIVQAASDMSKIVPRTFAPPVSIPLFITPCP